MSVAFTYGYKMDFSFSSIKRLVMTNLSDKTLPIKILRLKFHFKNFQLKEMINMEFGMGPVPKAKRMCSLQLV